MSTSASCLSRSKLKAHKEANEEEDQSRTRHSAANTRAERKRIDREDGASPSTLVAQKENINRRYSCDTNLKNGLLHYIDPSGRTLPSTMKSSARRENRVMAREPLASSEGHTHLLTETLAVGWPSVKYTPRNRCLANAWNNLMGASMR